MFERIELILHKVSGSALLEICYDTLKTEQLGTGLRVQTLPWCLMWGALTPETEGAAHSHAAHLYGQQGGVVSHDL